MCWQVTPLSDANQAEPSSAVVRSVEFHPNGQLLLTAGMDKRLRLFQARPWSTKSSTSPVPQARHLS